MDGEVRRAMSDREPCVSVVIPVFNSARYIEQTMLSACAQTLEDIEILVVDDGSTDESATIAEQVGARDDRVSVHRFSNAGGAVARNRGIHLARGEYIAFLDHDDVWFPRKLEVQIELLKAHPDASLVGCRMAYVGATGQSRGISAHLPVALDQAAIREARLTPFPTLSAAVVRAGLLRTIGGFPDLFGARVSLTEDLFLYARLARCGPVLCVPDVLGEYRVHEGAARSASAELFLPALEYTRRVLDDESFRQRHSWPAFCSTYRPKRADRRRLKGHTHYRLAGQAALNGRRLRAFRHLVASLVLTPTFVCRRVLGQLGRQAP